MLQDSPCFKQLLGCDNGQGDTGGSTSSDASYSAASYSYSSSSRGYTLQFSRSSSRPTIDIPSVTLPKISFGSSSYSLPNVNIPSVSLPTFSWSMGSAGSSARNLFGLSKEKLASYTLTAKNMTSDWLRGIKIYHGPLPFGSIFDPTRSSKECAQVGTSVECTTDLAAGQSKPLTLAYKVNNSMSCLMAKALQSAKTVVGQVTGKTASGSTEPVSVTVSCTMQTVSASGSGNGLDTAAGGAGGATGAGTQKIASYSVTAQNITNAAIKGAKVTHGPVPAGFVFDPTRSAQGCKQVGQNVECTTDLAPGETKPMTIAYKVSDTTDCSAAPSLLTAKASASQQVQGAVDPVKATVNCTVQTVQKTAAELAAEAAAKQGTGAAGAGTQKIASYSVTAQNITNAAIKGAKVTHGPVPAGFVFDPTRSAQGCKQVGQNVECTTDLAPGETKPMTIAYKVSDTTDCSAAPSLATAKTAQAQSVRVSVNCAVQTVQKTAAELAAEQAAAAGIGRGNASYDGRMPTTGAETSYFMPVRNTIQLTQFTSHEQGLDVFPTVSVGLASTVMVVLIFSAIYLQRKAKRAQI